MLKLFKRWRFALPMLAALALAALALGLSFSARQRAERQVSHVASLMVEAPARLTRALRNSASRLQRLWDAEERARRLEEELALLRLEYRQIEESYQRALKRGHILEINKRYLTKLIPVGLLARDPGTWFQVLLLDKGSGDGVEAGQGLLCTQGVVGKVLSVQQETCKAVFLTDSTCRLSVRDARSRVLAILVGDGRKGCRLEYVAGQDDVKVGDLIETAPGLSFQPGIPAGLVTRVLKLDNGLKLGVEVQPAAELNRLEGLYLSAGRE
jgi:rod shape-determining protein MreC